MFWILLIIKQKTIGWQNGWLSSGKFIKKLRVISFIFGLNIEVSSYWNYWSKKKDIYFTFKDVDNIMQRHDIIVYIIFLTFCKFHRISGCWFN